MAEESRKPEVPDVEAIVAEIRRDIRAAEETFRQETAPPPGTPTPEQLEEGLRAQSNLYENLHAVNSTYMVGAVPPTPGLRGRVQRHVYADLLPLVHELNEFHIRVVRVLNKLVRILDGHDTEVSSEILLKTQRRVDLLTELCDRLARLEDLKLEARLQKLEAEAARSRPREAP
jgi:hypothetical protein